MPAFPDNIVVFPDRDFVTVEGFQDHVGQTATRRGHPRRRRSSAPRRASSTRATSRSRSTTPVAPAGAPGPGLKVTPDISAGDKVVDQVRRRATLGDTIVQDAAVDRGRGPDAATRLTVTGNIAAGVNQAQTEQRIVNPDLTDTDVGRRDVRAVPGPADRPPTRAATRPSLELPTADTFTATYDVRHRRGPPRSAANGGGERIMSWQVEDGDANRQGLTIAEYGELGRPRHGRLPRRSGRPGRAQAGDGAA